MRLCARFAWLLCSLYLDTARTDSAVLIAEPQDFDQERCACLVAFQPNNYCHPLCQVFDSELCWLVLFTSLHDDLVEDEAKRRFLLLPHYNDTFVSFATTTVEEVPDIAFEFGVDRTKPEVCALATPATQLEAL